MTYHNKMSNIELLRIKLFLMVICIHVTSVGLVLPNGLDFWSGNYKYAMYIRIYSNCAVLGFILISGYLLSSKQFNAKRYYSKLLTPFIVYMPMYIYLYHSRGQNSLIKILDDFFKLVGHFYHLWYVIVLLIFSLFIPYINKLLSTLSKTEHIKLCFVSLIVTVFVPLCKEVFNSNIFSVLSSNTLMLFFCLYIIGAYMGKFDFKLDRYILICGYFIFVTIIYIYAYINKLKFQDLSLLDYNNNNIVPIIMAGLLFTFFLQIKFSSKIIEFIGGKTYGAYIIHVFYIITLQEILPFATKFKLSNYFIYDVSFIILVFVSSVLTETVRQVSISCVKGLIRVKR